MYNIIINNLSLIIIIFKEGYYLIVIVNNLIIFIKFEFSGFNNKFSGGFGKVFVVVKLKLTDYKLENLIYFISNRIFLKIKNRNRRGVIIK